MWLRQSLEAAFFTMSSFKLEMRERQPCPGRSRFAEAPARRLGRMRHLSFARGLLLLRVVRRAAEVNSHTRLVTHRPRIVSGRDVSGIAGADLALRSILHHNLHPAR